MQSTQTTFDALAHNLSSLRQVITVFGRLYRPAYIFSAINVLIGMRAFKRLNEK